jgi:hypothetical protein
MRVKGAALDHQVEDLPRFLRAIGVQLYGMARGVRALGKDGERRTGAAARVKNASLLAGKLQAPSDSSGFCRDKRVVTQLQSRLCAHVRSVLERSPLHCGPERAAQELGRIPIPPWVPSRGIVHPLRHCL